MDINDIWRVRFTAIFQHSVAAFDDARRGFDEKCNADETARIQIRAVDKHTDKSHSTRTVEKRFAN